MHHPFFKKDVHKGRKFDGHKIMLFFKEQAHTFWVHSYYFEHIFGFNHVCDGQSQIFYLKIRNN